MSNFRMPDSFYEPPDEVFVCDHCDDEGCRFCSEEHALDWEADRQMQAMKDRD